MMMAVASLSWTVWPSIAITGARGSRPLMAMLLQMLAGGWGAWERSGRHYGWGGSSIPPAYTTITSVMTRIDDDDTNVGWATLH
jgi:hypothetical protein